MKFHGTHGGTKMARDFNEAEAFSRNIGWVTETEQYQLRGKRVAIAGLGGVGGAHLLTLARLGIGAFHIADLDTFEIANFNRQAGAMVSTLGQPKVEVLARQARDINPELDLRLFPAGVTLDTMDDFLRGADLFVDGLDFFVPEVRSREYVVYDLEGHASQLALGGLLETLEIAAQGQGIREQRAADRDATGLGRRASSDGAQIRRRFGEAVAVNSVPWLARITEPTAFPVLRQPVVAAAGADLLWQKIYRNTL